jgi:hypothetical protein
MQVSKRVYTVFLVSGCLEVPCLITTATSPFREVEFWAPPTTVYRGGEEGLGLFCKINTPIFDVARQQQQPMSGIEIEIV